MRTILLIIEYDGTNYCGWQRQPNGISIQSVIEEALYRLTGENSIVRSAGRTDAGVHALAMPAAFTTDSQIPLYGIIHGLNRFLPPDIAIRDAKEMKPGFKPIADAISKHYQYCIYNSKTRSPIYRYYSWNIKDKLDIDAMIKESSYFVGKHNFAAFRASNCNAETTERIIYSIDLIKESEFLKIDVIGSGFLKNMVRIMVGTLVDVGRGKLKSEVICKAFQSGDRKDTGITAPACGLKLVKVEYPATIFL